LYEYEEGGEEEVAKNGIAEKEERGWEPWKTDR
jgi:hypothetical protein